MLLHSYETWLNSQVTHYIICIHHYSKMHYASANKTTQENTHLPRSSRFLSCFNNTAISNKISWSEHFPRNLQECCKRALALKARYQTSEGINLGCIAKVMPIQTESSDLNEIRWNDTTARSNACWKCGEVTHFHRDFLRFGVSSQGGDSTNTVIGQMLHILTLNSESAQDNHI